MKPLIIAFYMRIAHLEIANFRKLLAVRVDLNTGTTLLVGANNSGKTSAMIALRHFLVDSGCFCMNDFTLCHWPKIRSNGDAWLDTSEAVPKLGRKAWTEVVPTIDIWLYVSAQELHYVSKLIPTLDWAGGLLGVRLRFEPADLEAFRKDFVQSVVQIEETKKQVPVDEHGKPSISVSLWPTDMVSFLEKRLGTYFKVHAYLLDPSKLSAPSDGQAKLQTLEEEQEPVEIEHLRALMRIDEIDAQRGFGHSSASEDDEGQIKGRSRLSAQLRSYFAKHLDPSNFPNVNDLGALAAIEAAQRAFDERLEESFKPAFQEVEGLGYPGVTDPKITISTILRPVEGLRHDAAVKYRVDVQEEDGRKPLLTLPEDFNGLGYQNLISMVFRLMSFRDAWMRVGKAAKQTENAKPISPLHLVLIEEPEAHLHVQVQQVFAKKALEILRAHPSLTGDGFTTQLVISTHSTHNAHELDFACLRYFRRLPAGQKASVPVSTVINLSKVFGTDDETKRFVTRYLKAQHCDLFFADAAILVEGPAERMLVPHFIRERFKVLNHSYVTLLEIGGSHAHRLRPLIEELGLLTLIVTDLDSQGLQASTDGTQPAKIKAMQPQRGVGQTTNNDTLKGWCPEKTDIDELLDLQAAGKIRDDDGLLFAVRVAYQTPCAIELIAGDPPQEAIPYTFEDALAFANHGFFQAVAGSGLVAKFRKAALFETTAVGLGTAYFDALRGGNKAEFALDVLFAPNFNELNVPAYIREGLEWLEERLVKKQAESLPALVTAAVGNTGVPAAGEAQ